MKKATVVVNHCNCHPETCCCNDWLVLDKRGTKVGTFYAKESADRVANTLNALDEDAGEIDVNLKELKIAVDAANEYAGDTDAEVFVVVGKRGEYKIANIMQGGVIPAVYITVGEKVYDACK